MTTTSKVYPYNTEDDSTDLLAKISSASALEQSGNVTEARVLYEEVMEADPSGMIGASARKALEALDAAGVSSNNTQVHTTDANNELDLKRKQHIASLREDALRRRSRQLPKRGKLQGFYNLPISRKQLIILISSQVLSLGLLGVSAVVIIMGWRSQLAHQAESELAVTQLAYNIKINQMEIEFQNQSSNPVVIAAARIGQPPPVLRNQVKTVLLNEINTRNIEYATLVGRDLRIIVNANADRQGQNLDASLSKLVSQVLQNPQQIKQTEIVTRSELDKEKPPLPEGVENQDALIRYVITPVRDPSSQVVLGVLVAGDIVNNKIPIVETTISSLESGYSAVYQYKQSGGFTLATSQEKIGNELQSNQPIPNKELLSQAVNAKGKPVTERVKIGENAYIMAAKALPSSMGKPTAILVRGMPESGLSKILLDNLWLELALGAIAIGLNIVLVIVLGKVIAEPIEQLAQTAQKYLTGDRTARAEVIADDEIGQLARSFNQMADNIQISQAMTEEQINLRQAEMESQSQENERLQQAVINLLLDIEGAKSGDLTVRAKVDGGEMGSIADAFNATIYSIRELVTQVQTTADHVQESAFSSEASVRKLSQEATTQAKVIAITLHSVADMGQSIQSVANSAQEAAAIARKALLAAQEGWETMDETVGSIQNIRVSVTETSKKVKRLAESSQEIYKIVSIISGISEKTNLLAFNASIEAARAGKNGQGFRVVADEVRRLAERVTNSTKEIEQLVSTIQKETDVVLQTMEQSTKQVVTGTQLVAKTKQTLENLALISQKIDQLLQSISVSTVSQTEASKMVNETMEEVAAIAKNTSSESEAVSSSLKALVSVAQELQGSMSKFRVDK